MEELRRAERIRSFLRAQIVFNNRMSTIDCIIKNISPSGAKVALSSSYAVPTEFDIDIPQKGRTHRARLIWRDNDASESNSSTRREPRRRRHRQRP
jgi:PilZ domain